MASEPKVGLERRREFLVYTVIFVIAGGSLFDVITDKEHWPFSPYPMFSRVLRDYTITRPELVGFTEGEPSQEISITRSPLISPLNIPHLSAAVKRAIKDRTVKQGLEAELDNILERYETARQTGDHDEPPLQGIRLYNYYWELDPLARNLDQPDRRELILEVIDPQKQ